ncbi:MAG: ATP-dependent DNA ligase [Chloroflexaceae bacterium]|jgi:DNA ligase-1|nr:ATP-dependent DNA ligase [Chloroflexaceae bacterium]
MKSFAQLYTALDETTKTNDKLAALRRYFESASPADAAWALYFLMGRRPRQVIGSRKLSEWAIAAAGIPDWLFGESYDAVGDFAETVALLLPEQQTMHDERGTMIQPQAASDDSSLIVHRSSLQYWIEGRLLPLQGADETTQRAALLRAWAELDGQERFVWNKLITGGFRVGVSQRLVTRALALVGGMEDAVIAHRLMGEWTPNAAFYQGLFAAETSDADLSRPYPFCLAYPLEDDPATLGEIGAWQAEWKWDGIRSQLIRRGGQTFLWSRGEELISERFPELVALGELLPDGTVIDGEILPWQNGAALPFAQLQRRIGRKQLTKKILSEVPVIILAYDLLELNGVDVRAEPLHWRRAQLAELVQQTGDRRRETGDRRPGEAETGEAETGEAETGRSGDGRSGDGRSGDGRTPTILNSHLAILNSPPIELSPTVAAATWEELAAARNGPRQASVEGLMLKRRDSPYRVGRQRGDWWKWKVNPFTVDAVLIYAQRGSGKRASLYTDYTFGVWDEGKLVPFAKAYSGLTDAEIRQVDAFIRRNTVEKFGPVRTVKPELVFELAFEGIQRSTRHKSGIAVRFPRMLRWRHDKPMEEADSLETIRALLPE